MFAVIFTLGIAFSWSSCKVYKPAYYFKDITRDTIITGFVTDSMELKIQKNDVLNIFISSLSATEDQLFNKPISATSADAKQTGFMVSSEGNIYIHKLGKVAAAGLTRKELKARLETDLLPFLKDPIVTVNFGNHRITVLGELNSMLVDMPEERIPLLEVMAKSSPVSQNSLINKVMVVRESNNAKEIKHLNLEDPSIFTSPWYYLQPNDIVIVKPNEDKINDEQRRTRNLVLYSTVISGLSFLLIVIDRLQN